MVTLNINIEGDGKTTSDAVNTSSLTQQDMPSPTSQSSAEAVELSAPSPESFDNSFESVLSTESVPQPQDSGISTSAISDQSPIPVTVSAEQVNVDTGMPEPSDTGSSSAAKPATKRKPRATKSKTSRK